jgi:hypothetical protein
MKAVTSVIFAVLCSTTAFANDTIEFQGKDAKSLFNSLIHAGAYVDSGAGRLGTSAADLSCFKFKSYKNSAICTVRVQNEEGGLSFKSFDGAPAEKLVALLIDGGVVNCAMEHCRGEAVTIECSQSIDPLSNDSQCSVEVR